MRLVAASAVVLILATAPATAATAPPSTLYSETKERLDADAMERLVAEPMALARADDWAGGQRAFERLIDERRRRYGLNSIAVSDTLIAFMILNFRDGRQAEALGYTDRSRDAVRAAWGTESLEYALVLNDLAQMDFEHHKPVVSPDSLANLREAYRIRRAQLGPRHKETISTLIYLGRMQGQRTVTGGQIRRAAPAIALLRRAIVETEADRAPDNNDNLWARAILVQTYARNGDLRRAMIEFNVLQENAETQGVDVTRYLPGYAESLQDGGFDKVPQDVLQVLLKMNEAPAAGAATDGPG